MLILSPLGALQRPFTINTVWLGLLSSKSARKSRRLRTLCAACTRCSTTTTYIRKRDITTTGLQTRESSGETLRSSIDIDEEAQPSRGIIIEIPLKPRKKVISLRIDEDALTTIDKFVARTGEFSRTLIITKLVEAFAEALKNANYNAVQVTIRVVSGNSPSFIEVVIPLKRSTRQE